MFSFLVVFMLLLLFLNFKERPKFTMNKRTDGGGLVHRLTLPSLARTLPPPKKKKKKYIYIYA